jgi:hypothetical protein
MARNMKRRMKDLRGLNTGGPLITRYLPDGGRAQLFKPPKLTKKRKASEEER